MAPEGLAGRRVLLAEDEYFIAADMADAFESCGAEVVGPASSVDEAYRLTCSTAIDGAVLDVNLRGETIFPVAEALGERGVPFVFATGYDSESIPARFSHIVRCEKPVNAYRIAEALFGPSATAVKAR